MAVKEAPPAEGQESSTDAAQDTPFVRLSDLGLRTTRTDPYATLKALDGREIVFMAVDAADGKGGSALVVPVEDVASVEHGELHLREGVEPTRITLPRGGLRTLATALSKIEGTGQNLVARVVKRKRGIGFE